MIVLINSDVIFSKELRRTGMPSHVATFLERLSEGGHELVVPEVTAFEFDREQARARDRLVADLDSAAATLRKNGIDVPAFEASDHAKCHPLTDLLRTVDNLKFSIVPAELKDYHGALYRACYRTSPHPPEEQSDEMRDLVIWETALRYARNNAGAILISRDKVHIHHRGDVEARDSQLLRAKDFERALEILRMETVSGQTLRRLLMTQWKSFIEQAEGLTEGANLIMVRNPSFIGRDDGVTEASAQLLISSGEGKEITVPSTLSFQNDVLLTLQTEVNGRELLMAFAEPIDDKSYLADLDELKNILGDE